MNWPEIALTIATVLIAMIGAAWAIFRPMMGGLLRSMVVDRLDALQAAMDRLTAGHDDHQTRLVRMETAMKLNGCMGPDGVPACGRRRGE